MAKILTRKAKKEYIKELGREVTISKPRYYFIEDTTKDFHISEGVISKKDLKKKDGSIIKTNTGKGFSIFSSSFLDHYARLKRLPQIIPLKDLGVILAETGIGKDSLVIDSGTGSGAVACFMARYAKEVVSYEIKDEHHEIAKENVKMLGLGNINLKKGSIYDGIGEKGADLLVLDVPEPWKAITTAESALKIGGFLVSYSPTIIQTADFVNAISSNPQFAVIKNIEIIERPWEVDGRKVRPKTTGIGHSGFLTFARRIS